jgi:hypothetical protein
MKFTATVIFVFMFVLACHAQNAAADFTASARFYSGKGSFDVTVNTSIYEKEGSGWKKAGEESYTVKKNDKYFFMEKKGELEVLTAPGILIVANHKRKFLSFQLLEKSAGGKPKVLASPDSLLAYYDEIEFKGKEDGLLVYTVYQGISETKLWLDPAFGYAVKRSVSLLPGGKVESVYEFKESDGRGEVWVSPDRYVRKRDGRWGAAARFAGYRLTQIKD